MEVVEIYKGHKPPFDAARIVRRLLSKVPPHLTAGIHSVVIRDSESLPRQRRRESIWSRNRKQHMDVILGLYHPRWKGELPWIELFLDRILEGQRPLALRIPIIRELVLSRVLYHELGHHIHYVHDPIPGDREEVADYWQFRLGRRFFFRRYWYLVPFFHLSVYLRRLRAAYR